jgi:predicted permease
MQLVSRLKSLFRNLFRKDRVEREFAEELEAYLEMLVESKVRDGMDPREARREARMSLEGFEQVREKVREVRMGHFLETMGQDFRYGARALVKSPAFTLVAAISLALGIGANTAIFSVVNHLLLRPLPYPDAQRIVDVWHTPPQASFPGMSRFSVSPANYLDWKSQSQSFEQMSVYSYAGYNLSAGDEPVSVTGSVVSSEFFSVFRTAPALGRGFLPEEEQPGRNHVVVISQGLWRKAFGANPSIVGQTVLLNSRKFTVIGVMPAGFEFPQKAELWTPLAWDEKERQTRAIHDYMVVARLNPDVPLAKAQSEMSAISGRLEREYPEADKGWGAVVIPLREDLVGDMRPALLVLFSAVGFVLLIACANVANLMLARGANRRKEIAIRAALGAPRTRIIRQLLCESLLLAGAGGLIGGLIATLGIGVLTRMGSDSVPRPDDIGVDGWALGFTLLVSLGAGVLAGVAPAFQLSAASASEALKQGTGRTGGGAARQGARKALVVSEVAMALVLLIGAGLMIRSFWKLQNVAPGFNTDNLLTLNIGLPSIKYNDRQQQVAFFDRAVDAIRAIPGVVSVGATSTLPLAGNGSTQPFTIDGRPAPALAEQPMALTRFINPDYFRTMGIPLRQGRFFSDQDREGSAPVIIISEAMARRFWPGESPVGRRMTASFLSEQGAREIVGVVGDVKGGGLEDDVSAMMYMPYKQSPRPFSTLVVRTASAPQTFAQAVSRAIYQVDKEQALRDVRTMEQVMSASVSDRRFNMTLLIIFAAVALALAAVGVYGVMNYSVTLLKRELGVRMALGASSLDVLRLVLGQGLTLTAAGVGVGLVGAYGLTRLMANLLYGITATDLFTFVGVSAALTAVGLLASFLPARRATKVDPMIALRQE